MKIMWTEEALSEIESIVEYVAADNPTAAQALMNRIFNTVSKQLPKYPHSGRPGRVEGTRELIVHRSYIAVYRTTSHAIEILTVCHTARLWPKAF